MRRLRIRRLLVSNVGLVIACGPLLAGCQDSSKSTMVVPETPPAESAKASMDYWKQMQKERSGKGAARR